MGKKDGVGDIAAPGGHRRGEVALGLAPRQRLKLAEVLLVSTDGETESDCQAEWDAEIEGRIQAIDQGRATGIPFEELAEPVGF